MCLKHTEKECCIFKWAFSCPLFLNQGEAPLFSEYLLHAEEVQVSVQPVPLRCAAEWLASESSVCAARLAGSGWRLCVMRWTWVRLGGSGTGVEQELVALVI